MGHYLSEMGGNKVNEYQQRIYRLRGALANQKVGDFTVREFVDILRIYGFNPETSAPPLFQHDAAERVEQLLQMRAIQK